MLQPATPYAVFNAAYADRRRQPALRPIPAMRTAPVPIAPPVQPIRWTQGGYGVAPWQTVMERLGKQTTWRQRQCFEMIEWYQRNRAIHDGVYRRIHLKCPYGEAGYPSCSQFAKEEIARYGVVKGILRGALRLCCCNPISYWRLSHHKRVPLTQP